MAVIKNAVELTSFGLRIWRFKGFRYSIFEAGLLQTNSIQPALYLGATPLSPMKRKSCRFSKQYAPPRY